MEKWFKHYISPHIKEITTIFLGIIAVVEFVDWEGISINHKLIFTLVLISYLLLIITDIYCDRLVLTKELKKVKQNNSGLKENLDKDISAKKDLQDKLNLVLLINQILISNVSSDKIKLVNQQIKLIEEIGNIEKTNQNSKNN